MTLPTGCSWPAGRCRARIRHHWARSSRNSAPRRWRAVACLASEVPGRFDAAGIGLLDRWLPRHGTRALLIGVEPDDNPANPKFRVNPFDMAKSVTAARRKRLLWLEQVEDAQARHQGRSRWLASAIAPLNCSKARRPAALRHRSRAPQGSRPLWASPAGPEPAAGPSADRSGSPPGERRRLVRTRPGRVPQPRDLGHARERRHRHLRHGLERSGWALPCCDQAVSALLEDLDQRD